MAKGNVLNFRTSLYFSGSIIFLGVLLLIPSFITRISLIATVPFLFVSLIIFTTHYRLEIDLQRRVYRHYVWLLGMKRGNPESFEKIDYVFIKRNKVSQSMHSRVASSTVHSEVFEGFLRFSEKDKIHLITARKKESLVKKLKIIASQLNTQILDYSEEAPVAI